MVHFTGGDILLFVIGFFLPPLAVLFKQGCGWEFLISIGLTVLGHVPGIIYAWWVIYKHRDDPRTFQRINQRDVTHRSYSTVVASPPAAPQHTHSENSVHQTTEVGEGETQTHVQTVERDGKRYTTTTTTRTRPVKTTTYTVPPGGAVPPGAVLVDNKDQVVAPPAY